MEDPGERLDPVRAQMKSLASELRAVFSEDPEDPITLALVPNADRTEFVARVERLDVDHDRLANTVREILRDLREALPEARGSDQGHPEPPHLLRDLTDDGAGEEVLALRLCIRKPALANAIFDHDDLVVRSERWDVDVALHLGAHVARFATEPRGSAPAMSVEGFFPIRIDLQLRDGPREDWVALDAIVEAVVGIVRGG